MDRRKFLSEAFKALTIWIFAQIFYAFTFFDRYPLVTESGQSGGQVVFAESAQLVFLIAFVAGLVVFTRAASKRFSSVGLAGWVSKIPFVWLVALILAEVAAYVGEYEAGGWVLYRGPPVSMHFMDWFILMVAMLLVAGLVLEPRPDSESGG